MLGTFHHETLIREWGQWDGFRVSQPLNLQGHDHENPTELYRALYRTLQEPWGSPRTTLADPTESMFQLV